MRIFMKSYVGNQFRIRWSLLYGTLDIENVNLDPQLLDPYIAPNLPATVHCTSIGNIGIKIPVVEILHKIVTKKLECIPVWGITLDQVNVVLVVDPNSKWRWKSPENASRFKKSVEEAEKTRMTLIETYTNLITTNLALLLMTPPSNKTNQSTGSSFHERILDQVIRKVEVSMSNIGLTMHTPEKTATVEFRWKRLRLCSAKCTGELDEERLFELLGVCMSVYPKDSVTMNVMDPWDLQAHISYSSVMQGLLKEKKDILMQINWPELILAIEPAQLAILYAIMAPMNDQAIWMAQAKIADEQKCTELIDPSQYMADYVAQIDHEKRSMLTRIISATQQTVHTWVSFSTWYICEKLGRPQDGWLPLDDPTTRRIQRIHDVERHSLVMDLLALRRDALGWKIPSFGRELPHVSEKMKAAADLVKFLETPIDHYYYPKREFPPFIETMSIDFSLSHLSLQCQTLEQTPILELFMDQFAFRMRTTPSTSEMDVVVHNFGMNDLRQSRTNIYPHILGRNPDCIDMVHVNYRTFGSNESSVKAKIASFSFLLVTSPLAEVMHAFTIEEDEEVLVWKEDPLPPPPAPPIIYTSQIERTYKPALLGGMCLDAMVELKACEICLLADPSNKMSHILALTCDTTLLVKSNEFDEEIRLTLVDVALQPCKIQMTSEGIDLELPGLRTLLELEGDGVDLEVRYELKTTRPPRKLCVDQSPSKPKVDTKRAWGVLRKAIQEGNMPEVPAVATNTSNQRNSENAQAARNFILKVSDFALNLSKEDVGLFGAIQTRFGQQMEISEDQLEKAGRKAARVEAARKERLQQEQLEQLHRQFDSLDTDGGGSLDHNELMKLVESLVADMGLTADETQRCHEKLAKQVDVDHSGDVSFEEFQAALNPVEFPYALFHQGTVQLTAQEYANPRLKRSSVPKVHQLTGHPVHLDDSAALAVFWKKYETQTGANKISLQQQSPRTVQEKMIRVFKNYEFAQEAWLRIVNPNLKPSEQSPWIVLPHHVAGAGMALFEQKLTKGGTLHNAASKATAHSSTVTVGVDVSHFVQPKVRITTEVHTEFGGFYFRMVDKMLPARVPALEFALEDLQVHGTVTMLENNMKQEMEKGVLACNMAIYCKYYNTSARQLEPFIEYYPLQLVVKKEIGGDTECLIVSDQHLQMNLTATFMKAVTTTQAAFYDAPECADNVEREHIKVLKGLCWVHNEVGVGLTYYVESRHGMKIELASERVEIDSMEYGICRLLNEEEELKGAMAENLKEKEMRSAFRQADSDNSGELDADEVHEVLRSVLKSYDSLAPSEIETHVKEFMALADTDNSGFVSWKEFQLALAKTRTVALRTLCIEISNYEPIHGITLDGLGEEVVVELIPLITVPWIQGDIESMYTTGVAYLNQEVVSVDDLNRGVHLLHLVADINPRYRWTQSYLATHEPQFCPRLLAIHITVDNTYGMTVTVKTAEYIRNETAKTTELLLMDWNLVPAHNPLQLNNEEFVSIPPYTSFSVPLPLLEVGYFSIRQVGETEWSDNLPLTVWPGRKTRQNLTLYDSIDGQPTTIEQFREGGWAIVLRPQLIVHNTLPCVVEYIIVQETDLSQETKSIQHGDMFDIVGSVNCRRMTISSGASMQISGLNLDVPARMKMRLMVTKGVPVGGWSTPVEIAIHSPMEKYASTTSINFPGGPSVLIKHAWTKHIPRTMEIFVPYWIQNRSGLDLKYKISSGQHCTWEQHAAYFGQGFHTVPLMVNAPVKATVSVLPYQTTPFEYDHQSDLASQVRKYLPDFRDLKYSNHIDLAAVGTMSEISCGITDCILGYEIAAAPSQFQSTKVLLLAPRYVVVNQVDRPLQFTPLTVMKKLPVDVAKINVVLKPQHRLILYRFMGKEKHPPALRCRDAIINEVWPEPGAWSPIVPLNLKQATCIWLRGPLGPAPYIEMDVQPSGATTFIMVKDRTISPSIRIENRSTQFALRYVQLGVKQAEEMVVPPMTWHSYAWDNPFEADLKLKVYVGTSRVPEHVDLMHMTKLNNLTPDGGKIQLHGEVYIDGNTRVLAVGDEAIFHDDRRQTVEDIFRDIALEVGLHGIGITIVDNTPRELMNITLDGIRVLSGAKSNCIQYDLHHFQVDDMTPKSMFPIVIAPTDSGFNSNKREGWLLQHGEYPCFHIVIDSYYDASMLLVDEFTICAGSLDIKLNLDYILHVLDVFYSILYPIQTEEEIEIIGIESIHFLLNKNLNEPNEFSLGQLMYFKKCLIHSYHLNVIINSTPNDTGDSGLTKMLGNTAGSIIGGIAHIAPEFYIKEIIREDRFIYYDDFLWNTIIYETLIGGCISQWYKVVGSIEVLGDPVGLLHEITDGFALALRQTKRDFTGKSRKKGEGAMTLVQTIIGAPSGAIGKATNGVGDILKKATKFQNQEMEYEPRHLPEGVLQSGMVLGQSIAHGITGLVSKPINGMKENGFGGFAKGIGHGAIGFVASPFIGVIGAVEKLSQSVHNTTHLLDEKYYSGTRRIARKGALKSIVDSPLLAEMEVRIDSVSGMPLKSNIKIYIYLYELTNESPPKLGKIIDKFKTKTKRNVSNGIEIINQSRIIDITSIDMAIVFDIVHKRKPLPRKTIGKIQLTMEQVYELFPPMPKRFKSNGIIKECLKSRKIHNGSIFEKSLETSQKSNEIINSNRTKMDEKNGWEQAYLRATSIFEEERDSISSIQDSARQSTHSQRTSTVAEMKLPDVVKVFPLEGADEGLPMVHLSLRYFNTMRN